VNLFSPPGSPFRSFHTFFSGSFVLPAHPSSCVVQPLVVSILRSQQTLFFCFGFFSSVFFAAYAAILLAFDLAPEAAFFFRAFLVTCPFSPSSLWGLIASFLYSSSTPSDFFFLLAYLSGVT